MDLGILLKKNKISDRQLYRLIAVLGISFALFSPACKPTLDPLSEVEPPVLHRLTKTQIDNTLSDLFRIGSENLSPVLLPEEIPSEGFSNQAIMRDATPFLVESLQRSLDAVSEQAVSQGGGWLYCHPDQGDDPLQCGYDTLVKLLPQAWRRPVTEQEILWINDAFSNWYEQIGFDSALRLSLGVILQSPDFLYLLEEGDPATEEKGVRRLTDWEIASRLSYFLWDTMPDSALFEAASDGRLQDPIEVQRQAMRMLQEPKARLSVIEFHRQWLGASYAAEVDPDYEAMGEVILQQEELEHFEYVLNNGSLQDISDLDGDWGKIKGEIMLSYEAEFNLFVNNTIFGTGTLSELLTSRIGFVSERTALLYGVETEGMPSYVYVPQRLDYPGAPIIPSLAMFQVTLPSEQRAGIFTQGAFLGGHSHPNQPSPVLRGVFLRERLLCIKTIQPPGDEPPLEQISDGSWTTNRERFEQHTQDDTCAGCHIAINGAGFPFENYDAVGAWRDTDNGAPVNASGEIVQTDIDRGVTNAIDMVEALAQSRQVHDCAVSNLYRYAMHRSVTDLDNESLFALQERFWFDGGTIPNLFVRIVTSPSFLTIPAPNGANP